MSTSFEPEPRDPAWVYWVVGGAVALCLCLLGMVLALGVMLARSVC